MAQLLSLNDIEKIIMDYIGDERKTQAVLLNGEWGCGKTFFIKKRLIPKLAESKYQIFQISLYGVSSVEKIQDMIYEKWIENVVTEKVEKLGPVAEVITKGMGIFGRSAVGFLENKIGTEGLGVDAAKELLEKNIGKNKKMVIIFDDIERAHIDIIELMGFLNNLSENNGYKLLLVANEHEINQEEDDIVTALKYRIALDDKLDIDGLVKNNHASTSGHLQNDDEHKIDREDLDKIANYIFGKKTTYERTREKLIGLTVPYSVSIEESFDDIASVYLENEDVKKIVLQNRESILTLFEKENHRNLRTLISAFIAMEDILVLIEDEGIVEKTFLGEEIKKIVLYTVYSAMRRATGKGEYIWGSNTRYGCVNASMYIPQEKRIYGYAFIDEYWQTQCINKDVVCRDIKARIDERVSVQKSVEEEREHKRLALNSLLDWYLLPDEEVKTFICQMKAELKEKKYYPQEFKDIICTLMRINNPNFGLNPNKKQNAKNYVYDSSEDAQFVGMLEEKDEVIQHNYVDWEEIDISEFVNLMEAYFEDENFELTKNMIRVLSEDKQFAFSYRKLTLPLLKKIEQNEIRDISVSEDGKTISDMQWNEEFYNYCCNKKIEFMNRGKFMSLFDYDKLVKRLVKASSAEIFQFCYSVEKVYSFSNLVDVYSADYHIIKCLQEFLSENADGLLNESKSRTWEIALRRLMAEIQKYESALCNHEVE